MKCETMSKGLMIVLKRECRKNETEAIFEKTMAENFTNSPSLKKEKHSTDSRISVNPNDDKFKKSELV